MGPKYHTPYPSAYLRQRELESRQRAAATASRFGLPRRLRQNDCVQSFHAQTDDGSPQVVAVGAMMEGLGSVHVNCRAYKEVSVDRNTTRGTQTLK